jgi:hypothetical protein
VAVLALGQGVVQLEQSFIEPSSQVQCEIRAGGIIHFDNCDLGPSGVAVQAHDGGWAQVVGGTIHGSRIGVIIGDGGSVRAEKAAVTECAVVGVCTHRGAIGEFEQCVFQGEGQAGLQIQGGSVKLAGCKMAGLTYGAVVQSTAKFVESGTIFERISEKEIFYAS